MAKILIIEDSNDLRKVVRNLIEKENMYFTIFEASSGETGIAKAICEHPDIVLMDIALPGINGIEATKRIKEKLPNWKIIVLTMMSLLDIKEMYETKNISALIAKKDLFEKLLPTIKDCLTYGGEKWL